MKNLFKKWMNSALAAAFCGTVLFSGTAAAAPAETDLAAFREAMLTPSKTDHRIFREQIIFFMPALKADLDFQAATKKKDELRVAGSLDVVSTNEKGLTTPMRVPFYLDLSKKKMTLYCQMGTEWLKLDTPVASATAVDVAANPEPDELEIETSMLKDVKLLQESDTQRTMLVTLDSNQIINWFKQHKEELAAEKKSDEAQEAAEEKISDAAQEAADRFVQYVTQGLLTSDIKYLWTIDKQDWQTTTLALDLSDFIQTTAKTALLDPANANMDKNLRELLESLAYYSELKAYTTFLEPKDSSLIEIPKEVIRNAKPIEGIFSDMKLETKEK